MAKKAGDSRMPTRLPATRPLPWNPVFQDSGAGVKASLEGVGRSLHCRYPQTGDEKILKLMLLDVQVALRVF